MKLTATRAIAMGAMGLAVSLLSLGASASPIDVDGSLADWGVSPNSPITPNNNAQWAPSLTFGNHTANHYVRSDGFVDPGFGGHDFDMVSMYSGVQGNTLYLAFVTGFDIAGVPDPFGRNYNYFMGDVFIDFGSNGGWYYNSESDYATGSWDLAFGLNAVQDPTATSLAAYTGFSATGTPVGVPGFRAGPYLAVGGDNAGTVDFAFAYGTNDNGMVDSNGDFYHVYEFGYELSDDMLASIHAGGNYSVFSTMNCGNDYLYLTVDASTIPPTGGDPPVVPVPPAAGLILLGMVGMGLRRSLGRK